MAQIKLRAEHGDASEFISYVEAVANGILRRYAPPELLLIKINNWFSVRWLRFSGKSLGLVGVCNPNLSIPPFVPNRVISQRRFEAPEYSESDCGNPIHIAVESVQAINRRVSDVARGAALVWYGAGSDRSGRGAIMAYIPAGDAYSPWYTGWMKRDGWELVQSKEIGQQEFVDLIQL